jgi:DNA-binding NtrC family response regulator
LKNKQNILIANSDREESARLAEMIRPEGCWIHLCHSIVDMMQVLTDSTFMAVIMDIDSLDIDNHSIRSLTLAYPDVCLLCTSSERFHPELEEALCYHIFACITKPVNPDEMIYWIRCIKQNQTGSRGPPGPQPGTR